MTVIDNRAAAPLPACRFRTSTSTPNRYRCTHPHVHADENLVMQAICGICAYVDRPLHDVRDLQRGASENVRFPVRRDSRWNWEVGITTAPRRTPTLDQCVTSLRKAGWDMPVIFAEPDVKLSLACKHLKITHRGSKLGAFSNWYLGLAELVMRQPRADAYLMVQDDAVFAMGLRTYLEKMNWPDEAVGVLSLYCPSHYSHGRAAGLHVTHYGWQSWGALAYVFPNHAVRRLLSHTGVLEHRRSGPNDGLQNVDSVVGAWCAESSLAYYVHVPSLVQHIGHTSTLYPGAVADGKRVASDFVSDVSLLSSAGCFQSTPRAGEPE